MARPIFVAALAVLALVLLAFAPAHAASGWPWGNAPEPFPWLNYLASLLPHDKEGVKGVTLYVLTRHEQTIQNASRVMFLNSPVAKALGIKDVVFLYVGQAQWPQYIRQAQQAGYSIDVAWGGGPTLFNWLDSLGLLEPLDNNTQPAYNAVLYEVSKLPKTYAGAQSYLVGSDGYIHWIGASLSSFGFTVNHDVLKRYGLPTPQYWSDLGNPIYGKYLPQVQLVGTADPTMSTSNTRMFEIILQAYGWDAGWGNLTLLAANAIIYSGSSDVRDAVIRGDIAVGTTIDFYGYTAQQQNPACEYIIPKGQSIVNYDPIAIVKGTKNPVQAAAFVAWVLSEWGGQQVWLDPNINRLPANPLVFDTPAGKKRPDLLRAYEAASSAGAIQFNETLSGMWVNSVIYYFKATLVNAHTELQNVWAALVNAYFSGKIDNATFDYLVRELTGPFNFTDPLTGSTTTFTFDYALKVNGWLANSSSVHQALMNAWQQGAIQKYRKVYQDLQLALQGKLTIPSPTPTSTSPASTPTPAPTTTSATSATPATTTSAASSPTTSPTISTGIVVAVAVVVVVVAAAAVLALRRR
ncbi:MAG: ABC transporter substrate-binding protein [Desulfurococcaceae archaeon]